METVLAHINDPVPDLMAAAGQDLPLELAAIISACLAKEPQDRPADARMLSAMLGRVVLDERCAPWSAREREQWWAGRKSLKTSTIEDEAATLLRRQSDG